MNRVLLCLLSTLVLAGCAGSLNRAAQSCPASIPTPVLEAGDTWRWQDDKGGNWYRQYVRRTEDGLFETEPRINGPKYYYDRSHTLRKVYREGQWVTGDATDFPFMDKLVLDFPLRPGKSWSHMVHARSSVGNTLLTYRSTYSVRGCEQVHVPAGTFLAVAIEEEQSIVGQQSYGSRTWWYAPDVKFFVKLTHGHASHPGFWSARDWALTSYQINPSTVAASQPVPLTSPQPTASSTAPRPVSLTPPKEPMPAPANVNVPVWEPGYEWKYRWSSPRGSGTFFWTVVREEIVEGSPHYVVKTDNREIYYTKSGLAWFMERVDGTIDTRVTPAEQRYAWPLAVGQQWESRAHMERPLQRTTEERRRIAKVEAWESVTVPAGTFGTFHIVVKDPSGKPTSELWFAPEARQFVKSKTFFDYGVQDREMLEYKLRPMVVPKP